MVYVCLTCGKEYDDSTGMLKIVTDGTRFHEDKYFGTLFCDEKCLKKWIDEVL